MGSGIATVLALSGIQVILKEINQKFLDVSDHLNPLNHLTVRCRFHAPMDPANIFF